MREEIHIVFIMVSLFLTINQLGIESFFTWGDMRSLLAAIGMSIGQNVAGGYRSWEQAVQMWWDEIDMWTYGVDPDSYLGPGGWKKIGHFTQVRELFWKKYVHTLTVNPEKTNIEHSNMRLIDWCLALYRQYFSHFKKLFRAFYYSTT